MNFSLNLLKTEKVALKATAEVSSSSFKLDQVSQQANSFQNPFTTNFQIPLMSRQDLYHSKSATLKNSNFIEFFPSFSKSKQLFLNSKKKSSKKSKKKNFLKNPIFVKSKVKTATGIQSEPLFYNKHLSCKCKETYKLVFAKLPFLLDQMSEEIDYSINKKNFSIKGNIFIENNFIEFQLQLFKDSQKNTLIELQRSSCDGFSFQIFWCEILEKLHENLSVISSSKRCANFRALCRSTTSASLPDLDDDFDDMENLDDISQKLKEKDELAKELMPVVCDYMKNRKCFADSARKNKEFMSLMADDFIHSSNPGFQRGALFVLYHALSYGPIGGVFQKVLPLVFSSKQYIQKNVIRILSLNKGKLEVSMDKKGFRNRLSELKNKLTFKGNWFQKKMIDSIQI